MAREQYGRKVVQKDSAGNLFAANGLYGDASPLGGGFPNAGYVYNGTTWDRVRSALGVSPQNNFSGIGTLRTVPYSFNGSNWDVQQNNTQGTLLASAARTTSILTPNQTNYNATGVLVYLNITAASGTGGLSLQFDGVDPITGQSIRLNATPTNITAVGNYGYLIYPGVSGTSGSITGTLVQATSAVLPRTWFVYMAHADSSSYTYSVSYQLIL